MKKYLLAVFMLAIITTSLVFFNNRQLHIDITRYADTEFVKDVSHFPSFGQGGISIFVYEVNDKHSLKLADYQKIQRTLNGKIAEKLFPYFDTATPVDEYAIDDENKIIQQGKFLALIQVSD